MVVQFLMFGSFLSMDLFLHNFTHLPLRFIASCFVVLLQLPVLQRWCKAPRLRRTHLYDLFRGTIMLTSLWVLSMVQISRVYHYIRGEAIIKLYMIFNILEIFNKLLSSLGQDILSAFYRSALAFPAGRKARGRIPGDKLLSLALHAAVVVAYVVCHSVLLFVNMVCLNVAMNSRGNALLTLLVSNNFVELKSSIFKRFRADNLFQIACSDAVERFQLFLFVALILLQDIRTWENFVNILPTAMTVLAGEFVVDYVKHVFLARFNRVHSNVYYALTAVLAHDVLSMRRNLRSALDPTHLSGKRMGLSTLPLNCVVLRLISIKLRGVETPRLLSWAPFGWLGWLLLFACVFALKSCLSLSLVGVASWGFRREDKVLTAAELNDSKKDTKSAAPAPSSAAAGSGAPAAAFRDDPSPATTKDVTHAWEATRPQPQANVVEDDFWKPSSHKPLVPTNEAPSGTDGSGGTTHREVLEYVRSVSRYGLSGQNNRVPL